MSVDPLIVHGWLSGRSIARGLPSPIPDHGGFRVDTRSDEEAARWIFPEIGSGLEQLARSITEPRYLLKACAAAGELRSALPTGWTLHAPGYFMQAVRRPPTRPFADGYRIMINRVSTVLEARIVSATGALAASGYGAEVQGLFIYDRIATEPEHRRKGLGSALMRTLHDARRHPGATELLVATEEGRALYETLGWETISPYSTASIVTP